MVASIGERSVAHRAGRLARGDQRHLGPHVRAVGLVEVDDGVEIVVVCGTRIASEKPLREIDVTMGGEVHREERDVRTDVRIAEPVVELDAIEDRELALVAEVQVLEAEVAVTVADPPVCDSTLEDPRAIAEEVELSSFHLARLLRGEQPFCGGVGLGEVVAHVAGDGLDAAPARRCAVARASVEVRKKGGHLVDVSGGERPRLEPAVGAQLVRQAHHVDGPVDDLALRAEMVSPLRIAPHGHEPQVRPRRQPGVEEQLRLTCAPSRIERAEVEERELHGLLDLEDLGLRQEHPRHVGLAQLDVDRAWSGIGLGPEQIAREVAGRRRGGGRDRREAARRRGRGRAHAMAFARSASASVAVKMPTTWPRSTTTAHPYLCCPIVRATSPTQSPSATM